jgi:lipopolysaccharide transport system permease protein
MEQRVDAPLELTIEAGKAERHYWADTWRFRELLYFLSWRDILVRYKQTAIGVAWALIRPLLTMLTFTIVFGHLARMPSNGVPYPILVFAGLLPWQFFSTAFADAAASLVLNANLVSKVYFPRVIVPTSAIVVNAIDFAISFLFMAILMLWYGFFPGWRVVFLPFFVLLVCAVACAFGYWFAALNVKYRDFRYVIPFFVQFGVFISPVGFSSAVVPSRWRLLYSLNPIVGVIDGFRWALLNGRAAIYWPSFLLSIVLTLVLLVFGITYFRRTERTIADII